MLAEYLRENKNKSLSYAGQHDDRHSGSIVYQQLIDILLTGNGAAGIIETIYEVTSHPVLLITTDSVVMSYAGYPQPPEIEWPVPSLPEPAGRSSGSIALREKNVAQVNGAGFDCYVVPVGQQNEVIAYLLVGAGTPKSDEQLWELLYASARVLALALDREKIILSVEKKYKTQFLLDLLLHQEQSAHKRELASRVWGRDLSRPHLVYIAKFSPGRQWGQKKCSSVLISNLEQLAADKFIHLLHGDRHIILLEPPGDDVRAAIKLMRNVYQQTWIRLPEGLRLVLACQSVERRNYNLAQGYREAGYALELGLAGKESSALINFDELGIYSLLYDMCDNRSMSNQMSSFLGHKLGVLLNYDQLHTTELYNSLVNYLENNCNLALTAEKLYIHPNTLRYRIKKIESLLKTDLSRLECVVEITLALKISQVKKWLLLDRGDGSACSS